MHPYQRSCKTLFLLTLKTLLGGHPQNPRKESPHSPRRNTLEKSTLWKVDFQHVKRLTASHMPSGQFSTLAAKSLPHPVDVDLRLMYQMVFSLIQHQKPAHDAFLSLPWMAFQIRCSPRVTTFQVEHSATIPFQAVIESERGIP